MIFASPAWLFALLLVPLAALAEAWLAGRDRERLSRLVARPLWPRVLRRGGERWRLVRIALLMLGAAGVVVALARPQWGIVREKVEREGIDVVLALDTSASMATADVPPSRFFQAQQALLQLIARLEGDRFALVAFEGEAYPLVPLTLDADALGLFLETIEPGIVPAPGTSVGLGLAKGLDAFVDRERRNKVMVLVSDGEDLEGDVEAAVRRAKEAGVVVHAVGVGTETGQPVPETGAEGRVTGYKRDAEGNPVVSRLNMQTLEAVARGTGGQAFRITPQDTSLSRLASAIEGMEKRSLAREYSYRRKERFQLPLAVGLSAVTAALVLPLPRPRRRRQGRTSLPAALSIGFLALLAVPSVVAQPASPSPAGPLPGAVPQDGAPRSGSRIGLDEILLRPRRATAEGRSQYARGNHPQALAAFEQAAGARPDDPAVRFNVADGLYKNGRYDESATLFRSLASDPRGPLAAAARFNLGNTLYQKKDFKAAVQAYRDTLRLKPGDEDTRRNLELALRALQDQEEQQKREQQQDQKQKDGKQSPQDQKQQQQKRDQQSQEEQKQGQKGPKAQPKQDPQRANPEGEKPKTPEQRADERFQQETGMPKERAMQLLEALQQNEKAEQKKQLALKRVDRKKGKDW